MDTNKQPEIEITAEAVAARAIMADQERMEREDSISSQDPHNKKVKKAKNRRPASMFALRQRSDGGSAIEGIRIRMRRVIPRQTLTYYRHSI